MGDENAKLSGLDTNRVLASLTGGKGPIGMMDGSSSSDGAILLFKAKYVRARYMAPVSRYMKPSRAASILAVVDLPEPAGPSRAIILPFRRGRFILMSVIGLILSKRVYQSN